MTKETHIKGGYLFALLALPLIYNNYIIYYNFYYRIILLLIYIYFSYFGSLLPDIDMRGSYISKRFPIIYKKIGKRLRHRGLTHSLIFLSILSFLGEILFKWTDNNIVFFCLSKEGVELFYPITINFSILTIKTNSKLEKGICKLLNFIVIFLIGYRFYLLI